MLPARGGGDLPNLWAARRFSDLVAMLRDGAAHREGLLQRSVNGFVGDGIDGFLRTVQCAHFFSLLAVLERQ